MNVNAVILSSVEGFSVHFISSKNNERLISLVKNFGYRILTIDYTDAREIADLCCIKKQLK